MIQESLLPSEKNGSVNPETLHDEGKPVFSFQCPKETNQAQTCFKNMVQGEVHPLTANSCISLKKLKSNLECPVCFVVPKVGPIYQCRNGHLLCNECHPKMKRCPLCNIPLEKLRNLLSEQLVAMIYPEYQFSADRSTGMREVIWEGQLGWKENRRQSNRQLEINNDTVFNQYIQRNVQVSVTTVIKNGILDVIPANWPSSLIMQPMPICIISRTGKEFFSNSSTVLFHPKEDKSLNVLTNLLNKTGLAGCVHFTGEPNCETRVLILLYSAEKRGFIGFIPHDQIHFIERVRDEIRKEKSKQGEELNDQRNQTSQGEQFNEQ